MKRCHSLVLLFLVLPCLARAVEEKPSVIPDTQLLKNCCVISKPEKERAFMKPLKRDGDDFFTRRRILIDLTNTYNGFDSGSGRVYVYSKNRHRIGIEYEESFK